MHSELQSRMGGRHTTPIIRKAGHYINAPMHLMGHYNGAVKKLGHTQGISTIR
jgi:hypothetical protein